MVQILTTNTVVSMAAVLSVPAVGEFVVKKPVVMISAATDVGHLTVVSKENF